MASEDQQPPPRGEPGDPENLTFLWGMTPLPMSQTPANFFVTGGLGSGKTLTLCLLLRSLLRHIGSGSDHRAIVFDSKGTIGSWLRGMNLRCPLHILNPSDGAATGWDMAADMDSASAAYQMATVLIPEDIHSSQPFFVDAARELLVSACLSFINLAPGKWTLSDVLNALQDRKTLLSLLERVPHAAGAARFIQDERTSASVLSVIHAKLQPFKVAAASWEKATNKISLQRWLRDESVIVFDYSSDLGDSFAPLTLAVFNRLAHLIVSQEDSSNRRTWIFLDDLYYLRHLDLLASLLLTAPSKGACVVLASLDRALFTEYLLHQGQGFPSNCTHRTVLGTHDQKTAAWAEQYFGPPLRAADFLSLPPPGPEHGITAFHDTPSTGKYRVHKSWDWVLANL